MVLQLDLESFHFPGGPELFAPLSLNLAQGETVALVGGTGSGKSALLTLLAGLHPQPLGGRLRGRRKLKAGLEVAYLGSDPEAFLTGFCATVLEEVGWTLFGWGWNPQQVRERVEQTLEELNLGDLLWENPSRLSGGQQQMVALACVWARRPACLLLDEPASRLDPKTRQRLQSAVRDLATRGVAVVWSTSNLAEVQWCRTVWSIVQPSEVGPAQVRAASSRDWEPRHVDGPLVRPWPLEWTLKWGRDPGPWTAEQLAAEGPLPEVWVSSDLGETAISVRDVYFRYPGQTNDLLHSLDWEVPAGECVGLIGINGAGKTTLARLVRGLLRPAKGSISVAGRELNQRSLAEMASCVSYTFQDPANLFLKTRVDAELLHTGQLLGLAREQAFQRLHEGLNLFGLSCWASVHPRELPAGVAALLGLALSWYSGAPVQILDEPLARLDNEGRLTLRRVLDQWRADGATVVLVAHDLDWLCSVCSCLTVLDEGKILVQGPIREVFADPLVRQRLGRPLPLR